MPDSFEFTIPTPTIAMKANRSASVVVDVTSRLDRHGSIRVEVLPGETADASWFGELEPAEFDLPAGETLRTTVPIVVPASVEAGSYDFSFRASAEDDPQVDFTVSPTVTMTVPEPAEPGGIPSWIFIVIGVLVAAVLAFAAYFLLRSDPEPAFPGAPNLVGMPIPDIEAELGEGQALQIYSQQANTSGSCVLLQSPPPDASTVSISVLAVPCPNPAPEIPYPEVLEGLCENVTVNGFCRDVESFFGAGYASNPEWGETTAQMFEDFAAEFTIDGVIVESVIGRTEASAVDALQSQGFVVNVVPDGSGGAQCAYLQHAFPQRALETGGTITLVTTRCPAPAASVELLALSTAIDEDWGNLCNVVADFCASIASGEPTGYRSSEDFVVVMSSMSSTFLNTFTGEVVPSVVGSTLNAAQESLANKGLQAAYAFPANDSNQIRCFNVVGQSPNGGTLIANLSGNQVNLQLEQYDCPFIFPLDIDYSILIPPLLVED